MASGGVFDQRRLINRLMTSGRPTGQAFELLKQLVAALELLRWHLKDIERDVMRDNSTGK